ncbi:LytTR family DNA-binding domain-containing protein [Rhodocytophaga aerolata]|uniref:LytTR family DNA-binding domain-containing protein n=1 Tax=Rhodocytophaga aerolata TaxID=455078 RepID=A0ABT8RA13_9BACT|nr:LytTR family DNA-binding domain-containing protein [Rhodocytophaga aerolata]MDO1448179.1 LytTR family DNA-binding domain-containing protein [Rhodocytophaga aerolata]
MISCIIVDDEQHAIDLLKRHISQTPFLDLVETTTNPVKALQVLHEKKIDLIFLDVQMPEMSGIEFIQSLNGRSKVILTTAYSQYALEGFDHEVVDYLLKPISFARFIKGAQRALSLIKPAAQEENEYVLVKTEQKGKLLKINLKDVVYIEGLKNYVGFFTREGERIIALLNMKDLEDRLPAERFVRTHKSFMVAVPYIILIEGNTVGMEFTSVRIPIGDTYREAFLRQMKGKILTNKN